jgi:hypothetical protein
MQSSGGASQMHWPASLRKALLAIRSSSEWNAMTTILPRGLRKLNASGSSSSDPSNSSFTAIRNA